MRYIETGVPRRWLYGPGRSVFEDVLAGGGGRTVQVGSLDKRFSGRGERDIALARQEAPGVLCEDEVELLVHTRRRNGWHGSSVVRSRASS